MASSLSGSVMNGRSRSSASTPNDRTRDRDHGRRAGNDKVPAGRHRRDDSTGSGSGTGARIDPLLEELKSATKGKKIEMRVR